MYSQVKLLGNSGHVEKEFIAKEPELIKYLAIVRRMETHFTGFTFCHIPRSENAEADELQKQPRKEHRCQQTYSIKSYQSKPYEKRRNVLAACIPSQARTGDHPYSHTSMENMSRKANMKQIE